jgi:rare lipoprotein A
MYVPATHAQTPVPAVPAALVEMAGGRPFAEASRRLGSTAGEGAGEGAGEQGDERSTRVSLKLRRAQLNVLAGRTGSIAGALQPSLPGRVVVLQTLTPHGWRGIARARTGSGGRFRVRFTRRRPGSEVVRLRFAGDLFAYAASRVVGRLNVYRLAEASWYGGGGGLACGGELTSATMGVANKTLPCGTRVTIRYGDRTVRVRVIDRGPYVAGREFDLTEATKRALGFAGTGEVWSTS